MYIGWEIGGLPLLHRKSPYNILLDFSTFVKIGFVGGLPRVSWYFSL